MLKVEKQNWVANHKQLFDKADFMFVVKPVGLTVAQVNALRKAVKGSNGKMFFVKNKLAKIALDSSSCAPVSSLLKGVSVMVMPNSACDEEGCVGLAKIFAPFLKTHKNNLKIAGGVLSGAFMDEVQFKSFMEMPSRKDLLATIVFLMKYPLMNILDTLKRIQEKKQ